MPTITAATQERLRHIRRYLEVCKTASEKHGNTAKGLTSMINTIDSVLRTHTPKGHA